jgi:hypothetical protein
MSIPIKAIDRLFERLSATYGSSWVRMWADVPIVEVKTAWAHELAPFAHNLKAIAWALENLPDRCPNLIEFKSLCKHAPRLDMPALGEPKAPVDVVDKELAKIALEAFKQPVDERGHVDHKRWAKKLKARDEKGEILSPLQRRFYKQALDELL